MFGVTITDLCRPTFQPKIHMVPSIWNLWYLVEGFGLKVQLLRLLILGAVYCHPLMAYLGGDDNSDTLNLWVIQNRVGGGGRVVIGLR